MQKNPGLLQPGKCTVKKPTEWQSAIKACLRLFDVVHRVLLCAVVSDLKMQMIAS